MHVFGSDSLYADGANGLAHSYRYLSPSRSSVHTEGFINAHDSSIILYEQMSLDSNPKNPPLFSPIPYTHLVLAASRITVYCLGSIQTAPPPTASSYAQLAKHTRPISEATIALCALSASPESSKDNFAPSECVRAKRSSAVQRDSQVGQLRYAGKGTVKCFEGSLIGSR